MGQTNYLKMLWGGLFLAFAAFSCWATAESLYLTWPAISYYFCWIVAIGFFLIASIGSSMIARSFDKSSYVKNPATLFFSGVGILLLFWLICIMPTNTHTFLYRNVVDQTVTNDLQTTQKYLTQIETNEITDTKYQAACGELKNKVDNKLASLKNEIENPLNLGIGPKAKQIMSEFPALLGVDGIQPLSTKTNQLSVQEKQRYYEAYRKMIYNMLPSAYDKIKADLMPSPAALQKMKANAEKDRKNLELVGKYIENGELDLNNSDDIKDICDKLTQGYVTIKAYQSFVNFQSPEDKANYTSPTADTKVKHIISVFDLWHDFLSGNYAGGLSMVFCLIISILVDAAAFVFFCLTTKNN